MALGPSAQTSGLKTDWRADRLHETSMLAQDKQDFLKLVSGDPNLVRDAVASLNARPMGHFEDHPMSSKLVRQHIDALVRLWSDDRSGIARDWVLQFAADAQIADIRLKPLVHAALSDPQCPYLPTVLYTMSTAPDLFADCGEPLVELATHPDREVRWRVAYFIHKSKNRSEAMLSAIGILGRDSDATTQTYVNRVVG